MKEFNLKKTLNAIVRHIAIVIIAVVVAISVTAFICFKLLPDVYTAKTTLFVLNQQNSNSLTSSDLNTSEMLMNDYRELITSYQITNSVAQQFGLKNLEDYKIVVEILDNTRIVEISVTGEQPHLAANIANALASTFSTSVIGIMRVENVSVIDAARVPEEASGPARELMIVVAGFAAFIISTFIIALVYLLNTALVTAQDIEEQTGLPVLARFARIEQSNKKESRGR